MEANIKKILFATSIVAIGISSLLLLINLVQNFLLGWHEYFDAYNVVSGYAANTEQAVANVRGAAGPQLLFLTLFEVTLLAAGILGLVFIRKPKLWFISAILSGTALISWIISWVFLVKLNDIVKEFEIPIDPTGTAVMGTILAVLIGLITIPYIVGTVITLVKSKQSGVEQSAAN